MKLNKLILTENNCYKAGKKITVKGIMVHSTGANNPWLKRYLPDDGKIGVNKSGNHWNTPLPSGRQVCVHAFIGKLADGSIATYQTLPWNYRGWHAGGSANNTHIGFEICEDGLSDKAYFEKVYKEATELCAYLCKQYALTEKDIICHSEGYKKGIASNHGDVMHWFPKHGKSMDAFRADVKKILGNKLRENIIETLIAAKGIVSCSNVLNIRSKPTTESDKIGQHQNGDVITISAKTENGWYKVEYPHIGTGYLCADYVHILNEQQDMKQPNINTELTSVNDIVYELAQKGIISDKELWLKKLEEDKDSYWLARKTVKYLMTN